MRDLFQQCENKENVGKIARSHLELLIDGNYLKPTVWAESLQHNFAVSVGVRRYLRPLYLYKKLCDLSNMGNDISTTLDNVKAFQCVNRNSREFETNYGNCHFFQSTYNIEGTPKNPCTSCNLFFKNQVPHVPDPNKNPPTFNYLANCAEPDLVQEADTAEKLSKIKDTEHWTTFKKGCEGHIGEFNKLKDKLKQNNRLRQQSLRDYYNKTRETKLKTLKYMWNPSTSGYEIVTQGFKPGRMCRKKKRLNEK